MQSFMHRLVAQLVSDEPALTRNRHFATFDDALGRRALRISRHLRALERDILAHARRDGAVQVSREPGNGAPGAVVIRLDLRAVGARRVAFLSQEEYALLLDRPGVREALAGV